MGRSYYETVDPEFGKKFIDVSLSIPLLIIAVSTYLHHVLGTIANLLSPLHERLRLPPRIYLHGTAGIPRHRPAHRAHAIRHVRRHGGHECRENATHRNPAELLSGHNRKGDA